MNKGKVIDNGRYEGLGLREITAEKLQRRSRESKAAMNTKEFPTKQVAIYESTAVTGENCQGGMHLHFDAHNYCQHFRTCGMCVDASAMLTSVTYKRKVKQEERFDTLAYIAKKCHINLQSAVAAN